MRIRILAVLAALLLVPAACDGPTGPATDPPVDPPTDPRPLSSYKLAVLRPQSSDRADIFLVNADGAGGVALTSTPESEFHPSWSPDGRKLVFVRATDTIRYDYDLWTIGADGTGATRLTVPADHPNEDVFYPAWSPDGARIAYTQRNRLYLMDADGRNRRLVETGADATGNAVLWVSWSPDGSRLAIERSRRSPAFGYEIMTMNADGSSPRIITPADLSDSWPAWSPDGSRIAFAAYSPGDDRYLLAVMNADGTGRKSLAIPPVRNQVAPTWSPDGRWMAYVSYLNGGVGEGIVLRPDGTEARSLGPAKIGPIAWRP